MSNSLKSNDAYRWRSGFDPEHKIEVIDLVETCEAHRDDDGRHRPDLVVDTVMDDEGHALRPMFPETDGEAAHKFREQRVRHYQKNVVIIQEVGGEIDETPYVLTVSTGESPGTYSRVEVESDADLYHARERGLAREVKSLLYRYRDIPERFERWEAAFKAMKAASGD